MKRFSYAVLLMLLSSTAHAREYSFSIGGHRIHIEAARHCRSLSCVSWSEFGTGRSHRDDDEAVTPAPAKPVAVAPACAPAPAAATPSSAPAPVPPPPISAPPPAPVRAQIVPAPVTPAPAPVVQPAPVPAPVKPPPVVQAQAPSSIELAAANAQPAPKPDTIVGKPKEKAAVEATMTDKPVETPDWAKDWTPPAKDTTAPAKAAEKPTKAVAHPDDTPVGDWQTEGKKGLVRIEKCGASLCGYLLNEATNATGETVLSNMKPKNDTQWSGDIYSRASGNTYYARMTFTQPDTLRVEACAIGRFFCSGNDWTRVVRSDEVVTSRDLPVAPKS
jgi:uncharacterized protein (DUF2147 family)